MVPKNALIVATGVCAYAVAGAAMALYGPVLPIMSERFALTTAEAGLLLSAHWLGAFAAVIASLLAGARPVVRLRAVVAVLAMLAGAAALAAAPSWPVVLIGAAMIGIGLGFVTVGFNGLFYQRFGERSPRMIHLLAAALGAGTVAGPVLFVATDGHRSTTYVVIAIAAAALVIPAALVDDRVAPSPARSARRAATSGAGRVALLLSIMTAGIGLEACLTGWGPTALLARGMTELEAATQASLFFVAFLLTRIAAIAIAGRLAPRTLTIASLATTAALVLMAEFVAPALIYVVCGATVAAVFPSIYTWIAGEMRDRGSAPSLIVCAAMVGGASFPLILGVLAERFRLETLFAATAAVGAIGLGLALAAALTTGVPGRRPDPTASETIP